MRPNTIEYRGFEIDVNVYGRNEYSVQYDGDDMMFSSLDECKAFVDEICEV